MKSIPAELARCYALAALMLANPPRKPLKSCGKCGTSNEPDRSRCIGCGQSI